MSNGSRSRSGDDHERFVEFKAEMKTDLKYLRVDLNKLQASVDALNKKVNAQCTEIAILKTKMALYSGIIAGVVSIASAIITALLKG